MKTLAILLLCFFVTVQATWPEKTKFHRGEKLENGKDGRLRLGNIKPGFFPDPLPDDYESHPKNTFAEKPFAYCCRYHEGRCIGCVAFG
ncbi:hypothetical protein L596_026235 [Steinernema carpocapsae]|uniref:Uncharacterized protein n=1 Tax=Steinernema carpocapsae TaxID=34508 RepID=A0A4U5M0T5_STECR|nr:hypothetical protein L596_026235 [Steinernema carpocapsae]